MEPSAPNQKLILGIFIGVSNYESGEYGALPACNEDVTAMSTVISKLKGIKKSLCLTNEKSSVIRDKLIHFVQEYKGKEIDEVFFYFSGHGERIDDEYYYVLSDFSKDRKSSTGLQESYLDGMIRELNPRTFTKVVDACFSGTKYIKDSYESKYEYIKRAAEKKEFNQIYYFFSSRDNQVSYAARDGMSYFTDQFISSLLREEREARYIELSMELADLFANTPENQQPVFVMQGSYLDGFGKITNKAINQLMKDIGIVPSEDDNDGSNEDEKNADPLEARLSDVIRKSQDTCVTEDKIIGMLSKLTAEIDKKIPSYIKQAYNIKIENKKTDNLENKGQIGEWLLKKNGLYAVPAYSTRTVTTEQYVKPEKIKVVVSSRSRQQELIKRLSSMDSVYARSNWLGINNPLGLMDKNDEVEERVLKEIKTQEQYVSGFHYRCNDQYNIISITMEPNHLLLPRLDYWIVFIYSHKEFFSLYSYSSAQKSSWGKYNQPEKRKWSAYEFKDIAKKSASDIADFFKMKLLELIDDEIKKISQA